MDPISVTASILGLLGAAAKISQVLTSFITGVKDAPRLAQRTLTEVEDLRVCFGQLQDFIASEGVKDRSRTAMIMVDQLVIILTHSVMTFSELETAVEGLKPRSSFIINSRFKWFAKEHTITLLLQRLQASKTSLNLLLTTLTCTGLNEAQEAVKSLTSVVNDVLDTNQRICRRLENADLSIEQKHRSAPSALENTTSDDDLYIGRSRRDTWTISTATTIDASSENGFSFERDLRSSRVYSRVIRTLAQRSDPDTSSLLSMMGHIDKILVASEDDPFDPSLCVHIKTTGLYEVKFKMEPFEYAIVDVGGTRSSRRKWIHCMGGSDYVIYVADLNAYCQNLAEDHEANQMLESLQVFESITALSVMQNIPVFLFLNKADLFERTIIRHRISDFFPDYTGGSDYWKACRYFADCYIRRDQRLPGKLHCYVVDSLDTNAFQNAWRQVQEKIVHHTLKI
ncbi:MAG: hypothetical protein L6R40_006154 [Gallowayella cf. fulva]|nr:MAG: hypothetical protein L6R40_006154 [Xanthomendoza cf. fulva]